MNMNTNTNMQKQPGNSMATVSFIFGTISIIFSLMRLGFFSVFPGVFAIIFAILAKGRSEQFTGNNKFSVAMGVFGIIVGISTTIYYIYLILTDPSYMQQLNDLYLQLYGISFEDMLEEVLNGNFDPSSLDF